MYLEQFLFVGALFLHVIVFGVVVIVLCDVATEDLRLTPMLALCAAMFLFGLIGYLAFWIALWHYPILYLAKFLFFAWMAARAIHIVSRQRFGPLLSWLGEPLLYVFLFYLAVEGVGFANGGFSSPDYTAQNRFLHRLPTDNVIPFIFSSALRLSSVPSPLFADWLSSDRPPLQTGIYLLLYLRDRPLPYQIIAPFCRPLFCSGLGYCARQQTCRSAYAA